MIDGFEPQVGNAFDLVTTEDGVQGAFSTVSLPELPDSMDWELGYTTNELRLSVVALPFVENVQLNDGGRSRSMVTSLTVTFSEEVDPILLNTAFQITNVDSGIDVGQVSVEASVTNGKTIAVLTFDGASTNGPEGMGAPHASLADGDYRLVINASRIVSVSGGRQLKSDFVYGRPLTGGQNADNFFRFFGDSDGDRDVDGQDYGRFGIAFLSTDSQTTYNADFDFDRDGDIDGQDYGQFGLRFLKTL